MISEGFNRSQRDLVFHEIVFIQISVGANDAVDTIAGFWMSLFLFQYIITIWMKVFDETEIALVIVEKVSRFDFLAFVLFVLSL